MPINVTRADIENAKTPEEAKRLTGLLVEGYNELSGENRNLKTTVDEHAELLRQVQQKNTELQAKLDATPAPTGAEGEAELRMYLEGDERLRLVRDASRSDDGDPPPAGLLDDTPRCEWQAELQRLMAQRAFVLTAKKQATRRGLFWTPNDRQSATPILDGRIRKLLDRAPAAIRSQIRAMGSNSGSGGDWIVPPTLPTVRDQIHVQSTIAGLFTTHPLTRGGMKIPTVSNGVIPYQRGVAAGAEAGNLPLSTLKTGMDEIEPSDLGAAVAFHERASERAILDFYTAIIGKMAKALRYALADGVVNGNANGIDPIDSYAPGGVMWDPRGIFGSPENGYAVALDRRNGIWEGLRNRAQRIDGGTGKYWVDASAGFTLGMVQSAHGDIEGPLGGDGATVLTLSREAFFKNVAQWEQVQTVDRYGNRATVHQREVAAVAGARVVIDDFITADLNANGVYDGATKSTTSAQLFNREEWSLYLEQAARIQTEVKILNGMVIVVISWGGTFDCAAPKDRKNIVCFRSIAA